MLLAGKPGLGRHLTAAVTGRLHCMHCTVLFGGNNPLSLDALSYYSQVCTGSPVPEAEAHIDSDTVFGRFLKFLLTDSPVVSIIIDNYSNI